MMYGKRPRKGGMKRPGAKRRTLPQKAGKPAVRSMAISKKFPRTPKRKY